MCVREKRYVCVLEGDGLFFFLVVYLSCYGEYGKGVYGCEFLLFYVVCLIFY